LPLWSALALPALWSKAEAELPKYKAEAELPKYKAEAELPKYKAEAELPKYKAEAELPHSKAEEPQRRTTDITLRIAPAQYQTPGGMQGPSPPTQQRVLRRIARGRMVGSDHRDLLRGGM